MPSIRPISDLRNNSNEISEFCRSSREPVFITKNGVGDMVVMSVETYERQQGQLELYAKLSETEQDIAAGAKGVDFFELAERLRPKVHGRIQH
jgi:prevent-host-death family protein